MATFLDTHPFARFIQFGNSMLVLGIDIHSSSEMTLEDLGLDKIQVEDLASVSHTLKTLRHATVGCLNEVDQHLANMGTACGSVWDDLLVRLDRLRVESIKYQGDKRTLVQALQGVWSTVDVSALRQRLSELRLELEGLVKAPPVPPR